MSRNREHPGGMAFGSFPGPKIRCTQKALEIVRCSIISCIDGLALLFTLPFVVTSELVVTRSSKICSSHEQLRDFVISLTTRWVDDLSFPLASPLFGRLYALANFHQLSLSNDGKSLDIPLLPRFENKHPLHSLHLFYAITLNAFPKPAKEALNVLVWSCTQLLRNSHYLCNLG
jgi:hypothetical protein